MKSPLEDSELKQEPELELLSEDIVKRDRNDALTSYSANHNNKFAFTGDDFVNPLFLSCIPKDLINKLMECNDIVKRLDIKQDDFISSYIEYAEIIATFFEQVRERLFCPQKEEFVIKAKCEFSGRGIRPTKFHLIEDRKIKDKDMKLFLRKHSCNLLTADFSINSFFNSSKSGKIDNMKTLAKKMELSVNDLNRVIQNKKQINEDLLRKAKHDISFLNKILEALDKIDGSIKIIDRDFEAKRLSKIEQMFNEVLKNAQDN